MFKTDLYKNLLLIGLFAITALFTAFHERYIPLISFYFWLVIIGGFLISVYLAWNISTKRLLSLILAIIIIEYIKESIGIRSRMWTYHGINGFYNFGVWAWVLGGLAAYAISVKIAIRQMQRLRLSPPRWLNPALLTIISLLIPLTLGRYSSGAGALFYLLYAALFTAGVYSCLNMDFPVFAGIVITAWIVGGPSEYIGSAASNVWTFTYNPDYPPFFLVAGCWPLEILAQYSLSAFLAGEPLNPTGGL